jgi:hypothetical protein
MDAAPKHTRALIYLERDQTRFYGGADSGRPKLRADRQGHSPPHDVKHGDGLVGGRPERLELAVSSLRWGRDRSSQRRGWFLR